MPRPRTRATLALIMVGLSLVFVTATPAVAADPAITLPAKELFEHAVLA